jgi:hypothetical protein
MGKAKKRSAPQTTEQRQAKAVERHNLKIVDAARVAGVPDAQRNTDQLELAQVPSIGNGPTPIKETVRRLTSIERLKRSGVLEPHEAAACEWYADRYALGFDTIKCTANYEGGGSGGGDGCFDLVARYSAQMHAREDYHWAKSFIPAQYVILFEAIVCRGEVISGIATQVFNLQRSQAENKTRIALKFCANLLHTGIASQLPIDAPAPPRLEQVPATPTPPSDEAEPGRRGSICADLDEQLLRATYAGAGVGCILIAPMTLMMLFKELGVDCPSDPAALAAIEGLTYAGVPLEVRLGWPWGYVFGGDAAPAANEAT